MYVLVITAITIYFEDFLCETLERNVVFLMNSYISHELYNQNMQIRL